MKKTSLKLLMLFGIAAAVLSCNDDSPIAEVENLNAETSLVSGSTSGRLDPPTSSTTSSSTVFEYHDYETEGGGLEVNDAFAPEGHVIVGIGISVNKYKNVDRIVLATKAVNTITGALGSTEYHGFGPVGQSDNSLANCEVKIELSQPNQIITQLGVASTGSDMAHLWVQYRDYNPATRRLSSVLSGKIVNTRWAGIATQKDFTLPSGQDATRLVVTGLNLGCRGSDSQIDGFQVRYHVFR